MMAIDSDVDQVEYIKFMDVCFQCRYFLELLLKVIDFEAVI